MSQQYERQLKKGVLEMLVLTILNREKMYGYQLMQVLKSESGGFFLLQQGTLYPILYRLEDEGLAVSTWEEPEDGKAPKKYYKITALGKRELERQQSVWGDFVRSVAAILGS